MRMDKCNSLNMDWCFRYELHSRIPEYFTSQFRRKCYNIVMNENSIYKLKYKPL